jgi:hypothetical protein
MTYEAAAVTKDCACREGMQPIVAKIEAARLKELVVQDKGKREIRERASEGGRQGRCGQRFRERKRRARENSTHERERGEKKHGEFD